MRPVLGLGHHPEHLLGGYHNQAEAEMRGHLYGSAHHDMPSAVLFVQMAVDALDGAALLVAFGLGRVERRLFAFARVVVYYGHMSQALRHPAYLLGVVGRVGQVVEACDAPGAHLGEGNGGLAVVQTGRGDDERDGDVAVGDVEMQLVPAPILDFPFTVALAAPVAGVRQVGEILLQPAFELLR